MEKKYEPKKEKGEQIIELENNLKKKIRKKKRKDSGPKPKATGEGL